MKKSALITIFSVFAFSAHAYFFTNNIIQAGEFSGTINRDVWSLNGEWRDNGPDNIVFDAKDGAPNDTWHVAKGICTDLSSLPNYDADNTILKGFSFSEEQSSFFSKTAGRAGAGLKLEYFVAIDIITKQGTYQLKSESFQPHKIKNNTVCIKNPTWQNGVYLGDLDAQGGVKLSDIISIEYKMVMHHISGNDSGTTFFVVIDNPTLHAIISTDSIQGTLGMLFAGP
ncbi:hypothetical protein PDESU_01129 [Pontiella desulfatans]|uniref:PEP-CTERM sorting domain-containing protein n=1 Tax=Pontiella desulfatans TaxID=2750659 RepID=A0A6C2TZG9_PONDE|nr:hypothetical protein [Pontiella desulfatans]VGO12576.1 hypothetical protein PDESU_01129 [Pontiella desulfatans]